MFIEIPNVCCQKGFVAVKGWGSDIIDLIKIPLKKFAKKNLTGSATSPFCDTCAFAKVKTDAVEKMETSEPSVA